MGGTRRKSLGRKIEAKQNKGGTGCKLRILEKLRVLCKLNNTHPTELPEKMAVN